MLVVEGIRKNYGDRVALAGVDLKISEGEVVGLVGRNGAGKTTLLSIAAGLRSADRGSVFVDDIDVQRDTRRAQRLVGFAPQDLGIYPGLTVRENLAFFAELTLVPRRLVTRRIDEVASALSLDHLMDRKAREMSGGEKRRLHTATALLHEPKLLLLDEPTAGADVDTRNRLLEVVRCLAAQGAAVCYCTHYLEEVESLDATVAIIEDGQIIALGSLDGLIAEHGTSAVMLTFDGVAPRLRLKGSVSDGPTVRITSADPSATAARALESLHRKSVATPLLSLEIVRPSLESVYLTLTGSRYEDGSVEGGEQ